MEFCTKGIVSSNMVLLQNSTNCIFGEAPAGSTVSLSFGDVAASVQAGSDGKWKIEFNPGQPASGRNLVLCCGEEKITFENVAVGEVWICSGQSNMQLQMERLKYTYPEEFKKPENQNIRMITIPVTFAFDGPKDSVQNPDWKVAGPETLSGMRGTSYFFARRLTEELGIPVGVIACCQGGTPITAWMNAETMAGVGDYVKRLEELKVPGYVSSVQASEKAAQDEWNKKIYSLDGGMAENWKDWSVKQAEAAGWGTCQIPGEIDLIEKGGIVWFKKEISLTSEQAAYFSEKGARLWTGTIRDADVAFINGVQVGVTYYVYPPRRYDVPSGVLKEGVNTITLRVQQNLASRKMYFWPEKHYALASRDAKVIPTAIRNVEKAEGILPLKRGEIYEDQDKDGLYIPLNGEWLCCATSQVEECPPNTFFEYEPQALYNAMLSPCFNTAVRGALWYQGESNDGKAFEYEELLSRMIKLWREKFVYSPEKKLPFVVMQLPSWADDVDPDSYPLSSSWAEIREAQNSACSRFANTALSVAVDAGEWNDLHPEKKLTGGSRAAEQALRIAYGKDYPECAKMNSMELRIEKGLTGNPGGFCKVMFNTEDPLKAYAVENGAADFLKETKEVYGFSLLLKNWFGKMSVLAVSGKVTGEKEVTLSIPKLPLFTRIKEIRYLWANCPELVNLYSGNLPVMGGRVKV
ncbi:MAG: hypothetical protein MJ181_07515 [Treponema sp.]|nr:hypothetical protein [Treponema sp.]